jgi:probable HAF family extracellular repeat protein
MKLRLSRHALACLAAACGASLAAHAAPSYHLVDLGAGTAASGINNHGTVSGASGGVAAVWHDGAWHLRPQGTGLADIDDQGELVGTATIGPDGKPRPAYWPKDGAPVEVVTAFQPKQTHPIAVAAGQVAGYGSAADGAYHCFAWTPAGGAVDFASAASQGWCVATDINDAGQVTGNTTPAGGAYTNAFVWQDGVMSFLGTLPGGRTSYGLAINRKGHVAVTSERLMASGEIHDHAALWNGSRLVDLGELYTGGSSQPSAMNDHDDVVGRATNHHGSVATLFLYSGGQMLDLLPLIDDAAGWQFNEPAGIADDGTIVGTGSVGAVSHGYMLVPLTASH